MSAFVQSLLSSAFPNVKPPAPRGKPATTPAVVSVENLAGIEEPQLAFDAFSASVEDFEFWTEAATAAAVIFATLWLLVTLYLARRRRRARAAAIAQDVAAAKLKDEALRIALQEAVDERTKAFEERFQRKWVESAETNQGDATAIDAVRASLDDQIKNLEGAFEAKLGSTIKGLEETFETTLNDKTKSLEESFQKTLDERLEAIEETVRRRVNQRLEALETRIKLDQEAIDGLHKAISQRMEILEEGVRIIDGKQLDQEATHITHRSLNSRLETVETSVQALETKTRAATQRIEAVDDSSRVIDSRTKALSQRMEAVEDNLSATDGQVTLLTHDASRGVDAIEKMQKYVKTLPGNERIRDLTIAWEEKFDDLESRIEQNQLAIAEASFESEPEPSLTWSHVESQEIEPSGPIYTRPHYGQAHSYAHSSTHSFDGSLPPTPSSSGRSNSFSSTHTPITTPTSSKKRRIQMAGFTDTTFSSRQKLFAARQSRVHSRQNSFA